MKLAIAAFAFLFATSSAFAAERATITVPDLAYKSEVREFFYTESASLKASSKEREGLNSYRSEDKIEGSYNRSFGETIRIEYGEVRGMTARIREALTKNGYTVYNASPKVAVKQDDSFFDINKRIKAGEFGKAQYLLYGVISAMDYNNSQSEIPGSASPMNIHELNMTVDFTLIDTKTLAQKGSFSVLASGNDNKLGSGSLKPSAAKIVAMAGKELAEQVTAQMAEDGFIASHSVDNASSGSPVLALQPSQQVKIYQNENN